MNSILRIFLPSLLLTISIVFLAPEPKHNASIQPKEEPGYEAQYLRMKGKAPEGVWNRILEREKRNKVHSGVLTNITEVGPETVGGRTRAMIIDDANHNRFLAGGVSGGIWESPDKGVTWNPINDAQLTLSVTSLAQTPGQPAVIYFSTGESRGNSAGISGMGIFKSVDGGNTFDQLPATDSIEFANVAKVAVRATQPGHVFAATRWDGLWRSTDAGNNWEQVFEPVDGSTDVSDIEMTPDGNIWITANGLGIYKSTTGDSGSFAAVASGLPVNGFRRVEISFCEATPATMYAAFEDSLANVYFSDLKNIYKTTNSGSSWTVCDNPATSLFASFSFPWYCFLLSVKTDDPNYLVLGSVDMVYSTNGGASWSYGAYSHADNHIGVWDKDDTDFIYVGNDGGIHSYNINQIDNAAFSLNNFYNVTQFYTGAYYPSGTTALMGTQDNGSFKMVNGAAGFNSIYYGDGAYCQVNQQNPLISYVSYQRGMIARADDSDQGFPTYIDVLGAMDADADFAIDDGAWFINPFEINLLDGDQLYFTTYQRIWRTTDGANNWQPLTNVIEDTLGKSPYSIGISKSTNPIVYIGGEFGLFYRINNAATASPGDEVNLSASMPAAVTDHFISCMEVDPNEESRVYATLSNFSTEPRIWKIEEATTANPIWTDVSGDLPAELPVNWIECTEGNILIAATDNGLFISQNGGANWVKETSIPNVAIHMIKYRESDGMLFIPTHGRGLWTAILPPLVNTENPALSVDFTIFPNPAVDEVRFLMDRVSVFADSWQLFDTDGRMVRNGGASNHARVAGLSHGIYFMEVQIGRENVKSKLLIQ
jgi:photosystem II stability/assembly factor-like uncharacterized protein